MHTPKSTVHSSVINLVKTIVGSGLLAIPYAFRSDGILVGTLLTLFAALTSGFGLFVLAKCSKTLINPRNSSFFTLCMLTYPSLSPLFDFAMIVQCFGVGLSYLVLMGDIFPTLFGGNRDTWIILSAIIVVPLCSLKKLDHLKYSSILGIFALIYLSLLVISIYLKDIVFDDNSSDIQRGEVFWFKLYDFKGLLSTFSIIIFAYVGAMNLFTIINELKDNSMQNIITIINSSITISSVLFLSVGITGYLTFGSNTLGNIILNYNPDSLFVSFGKFALASMLLLTFPLLFHPLRIACNNLVVWCEINFQQTPNNNNGNGSDNRSNHNTNYNTPITLTVNEEDLVDENATLLSPVQNQPYSDEPCEQSPISQSDNNNNNGESTEDIEESPLPGDAEQHTAFPNTRFYWITIGLLFALYVLALRIESFALVLALVGATGSTSISFTLPGLFGYKLIGSDSLAIGQMISPRDRFYKRCSLLLAWFGILVMILSLYVTLIYGTES